MPTHLTLRLQRMIYIRHWRCYSNANNLLLALLLLALLENAKVKEDRSTKMQASFFYNVWYHDLLLLALCTLEQIKHVKFDCKLCTYTQLIFYNVWNHAFSLLAFATVKALSLLAVCTLKQ